MFSHGVKTNSLFQSWDGFSWIPANARYVGCLINIIFLMKSSYILHSYHFTQQYLEHTTLPSSTYIIYPPSITIAYSLFFYIYSLNVKKFVKCFVKYISTIYPCQLPVRISLRMLLVVTITNPFIQESYSTNKIKIYLHIC